MSRAWMVVCCALWTACAGGPRPASFLSQVDSVQEGDVFTGAGEAVGPPALAARLAEADFVLVGETHDNRCDHRFQAWLLATLHTPGGALAVGLEQVAVTEQPILDQFTAGSLTLGQLPEALKWNQNWGIPFDHYRPLFEQVQRTGAGMWALNLPKEVVQAFRDERLTKAQRALLPPEVLPPPNAQRAYLEQVFSHHAHHGGGNLERFIAVQALWDTQMARRAVAHRQAHGGQLLVAAGSGHVSRGWGIASRLQQLAPDAAVVTLMPWRGTAALVPEEADLFFYCPEK